MRYNGYRSAQIIATQRLATARTQAMNALEQTFAETMPPDMGFGYSACRFRKSRPQEGLSPMVVFGLSLLVVFLILAAQYESWSLPFSVLLTLPVAVLGAYLALSGRGMENAVYVQIGLIMLIGYRRKNAILIVEFAKRDYEGGRRSTEAALEGARVRFRPILMTSFAFILGALPLAIASGAGSAVGACLGTTVIGGMLAATVVAIFLIPACYYVVQRFAAKRTSHPAGAASAEHDGTRLRLDGQSRHGAEAA